MPPQFSRKAIDKITGLMHDQLMWNQYSFSSETPINEDAAVYPSLQGQFLIEDFEGATFGLNIFDNRAGSSGVFDQAVQPMPGYQRKNLETRWEGTGRRYPDVSVLAGGNSENGVEARYYVIGLKEGKPVLTGVGGTSAGAPLLAGLLANITSGLRKKFGKSAKTGFVNSFLYEQYRSRKGKDLLIDIPEGSNNASTYSVARSPEEWPGKYFGILEDDDTGAQYLLPLNGTGPNGTLDLSLSSTAKGFDAASGLGSINGQALFDGLSQIWSTI